MNRATGVLVIEVVNSNPNGNPDQENDPRLRPDERGMISPVSFKRKLRDLVEDKEGPAWKHVAETLGDSVDPERFHILETRGRDRKKVESEIANNTFKDKYWDARIFGNTFLEEGSSTSIKTGVAQIGMGVSVCPVEVERMTNTSKAGVQADKDRGMAPLAYRIVLHGVYVMPYFVNPTAASKSGCTETDITLFTRLIPFAYSNTSSYLRPDVRMRHAWHIEHNSPLGSCPDFALIEALTPTRTNPSDLDSPSRNWQDYNVPQVIPAELQSKVSRFIDLVNYR
jgi:Cas7 group CRISPR-associated protein Csh2